MEWIYKELFHTTVYHRVHTYTPTVQLFLTEIPEPTHYN